MSGRQGLRVIESPGDSDEWRGARVELTRDVSVSTGVLKRGRQFIVHRACQDQVFVRLSTGHIGPPLLGVVPVACVRLVERAT